MEHIMKYRNMYNAKPNPDYKGVMDRMIRKGGKNQENLRRVANIVNPDALANNINIYFVI